ncbi:SIS domain-containing protein [Arthrobacter ruber]|uniref:SIS domain-containing protein n=1 Tax=Arthrobacter ruber TaxID=1258893 RepID=UPI0013000DEB|nr:SIS domain-containing protein [Arthrobacter ruber]
MAAVSPSNALQIVASELATALVIDTQQLDAVTAELANTNRRWFTAGQGRSGLVAAMTAMRLMHLGYDTHLVGESTAPSIRSGNGIIVFSRSGGTPISVSQARTAKNEGAVVLAITENADSDLTRLATAVLQVPSGPSQQFGGSRFEQSSLVISDAIVLALASRNGHHQEMQYRHTNLH